MRNRRIIDSHAHVVQYIVGTGAGGELCGIGSGTAVYANGQTVRMVPQELGGDCVTPEQLPQVMDGNGVEKAVLLQGNFYGYRNYYTHLAVKKYPDRFAGAGAYDPFSRNRDGIRRCLFEELGFMIEKFEVSTGSGLMAIHSEFKLDGTVVDEACSYACDHGHVFATDIGKCRSDSWQVPELKNPVKRYPEMKFVTCHLLVPSDKNRDRLRRVLELLRLPNLQFGLSSLTHNCRPDEYPYPRAIDFIQMAKEIVGAGRLMSGTDMPSALKEDVYGHYVSHIDRSPVLTDMGKELVFYENAYEVYSNHKQCRREGRKMKKNVRKLGVLLLAGAMAVSTAGCMPTAKQQDATATQNTQENGTAQKNAGGSEAAQGAGEAAAELAVDIQTPITLRMNWWDGDSRHQATLAAIEKLQEKYPSITMIAEYEALNGHEEKIALGIKPGNAVDVMQLGWSWVPTYLPNGDNSYDLNRVSNILNLNDYTGGGKAVFIISGKLDAIPVSSTGRVFCWNEITFGKIGVEIPGTLDELLAADKAFGAYDESYYPLVTRELDRVFLMVYYLQCKYGKDQVKDGALQYSQKEVAEGFDFLKNLEDNHVIPTLRKVTRDGADLIDININWIDGHYAGIFLYDISVVKHTEAVRDGEFVIGDYVEMGDYHGGFIKVNQTSGISATTEHPAEAAVLIQFLVAEKDGIKTLGDTCGVLANKEGLAMPDLSGNQVAEANAKTVAQSSFQMNPIFERNSLIGVDGTLFNAPQLSSYGESDSMSCAEIVLDGVARELARQGR